MDSLTMQQPATPATKPFWQSSNFWTAIVLAIGGLFVGFPEDAAVTGVSSIFALLAAGKAIREYFTELKPKPDVEQAVNKSNFWNYLATIIISIVPQLPVEFIDHLQTVAVNIVGGNWQGALVALFSIVTILYNIFWKNKPQTVKAAV